MNAFLLMIPLFLIRFGLLALINKAALRRAALFAPLKGKEKAAGLFYQATNLFLIFYPLFLRVKIETPHFLIGLSLYLVGTIVLIASTIAFAKPNSNGLNTKGVYKFSRNPMYLGYFLYFLGCAGLTSSALLFLVLLVFQASAHWIILSEERWCLDKFGEEYQRYSKRVGRYF